MRLPANAPRSGRPNLAGPGGAAELHSLLNRVILSLAYFAGAAYLLWRMTCIDAPTFAQVAVPGFLCVSTALLLFVLAVITLARWGVAVEGPS